MNIDHLSVSRTQVWEHCKQQYKFKYHLKVPITEPEQPYFTFGSLVHRIIETYCLDKGNSNINDVVKKCLSGDILLEENSKIIPKNVLPTEYLNKLPSQINSFLKFNKRLGFNGDFEWEFNFDLNPPNNKMLYGFIDRLTKINDSFIIVDYKTSKKSKWRKTKQTITDDLQLQCYTMVVMEKFNVDPSRILAGLLYLDGGEFVGAKFCEKTISDTKKKLAKIYNDIETTDPNKVFGRTGDHCYRCEYKKMCPFWSLT